MNQKERAAAIGISDRLLRVYETERGCPATWPECHVWYRQNVVSRRPWHGPSDAELRDLWPRVYAEEAAICEFPAILARCGVDAVTINTVLAAFYSAVREHLALKQGLAPALVEIEVSALMSAVQQTGDDDDDDERQQQG